MISHGAPMRSFGNGQGVIDFLEFRGGLRESFYLFQDFRVQAKAEY
jgi:hypothetical protein